MRVPTDCDQSEPAVSSPRVLGRSRLLALTPQYKGSHNVYYVKSCAMSDTFIILAAPKNQRFRFKNRYMLNQCVAR